VAYSKTVNAFPRIAETGTNLKTNLDFEKTTFN